MFDRLPNPLDKSRLGDRQPNQVTWFGSYIEAPLAGGIEYSAEGLRQFAKLFDGLIEITAFANTNLDAVAADDKSRIANARARIEQHTADIIAQGLELFLSDRGAVDFKQNVRTTLEIQAKDHMALRPFGPALHHLLRQEIGNGKQTDDKRRQDNRRRLPPREIKHDVPTCGLKAKAAGFSWLWPLP